MSDVDVLTRHRAVWERRPELRRVYGEWFARLAAAVAGLTPVVEVGTGPGFFKDVAPRTLSTDVLPGPRTDVCCEADRLPFRAESVGALVLVDTLHHLPRPLQFVAEAARVLKPGGRVAMVEPWITPASWVLYRFLHHEECRMGADVACPFGAGPKGPLDGNAAIPRLLLRRLEREPAALRVRLREPFVGLPYLATLGFKLGRPLPSVVTALARAAEHVVQPLARILATRIVLVLEKDA
jgi:SAM-dependent methyltransferase